MRRVFQMHRSRVLAVASVLMLGFLAAWWWVVTPGYEASLVIVSDVPISDVEVEYDGKRLPPPFPSLGPSRLHAWDQLLPISAYPTLSVTWTRPDGTRDGLEQRMHHEYEPRCVFVLRLDQSRRPAPLLAQRDGAPRLIDDRCR